MNAFRQFAVCEMVSQRLMEVAATFHSLQPSPKSVSTTCEPSCPACSAYQGNDRLRSVSTPTLRCGERTDEYFEPGLSYRRLLFYRVSALRGPSTTCTTNADCIRLWSMSVRNSSGAADPRK